MHTTRAFAETAKAPQLFLNFSYAFEYIKITDQRKLFTAIGTCYLPPLEVTIAE